MLCLQSLFLIGCHALLAEDSPTLLLLPVGGEVSSALGAEERLQTGQRPSEFTYRQDPAQLTMTELQRQAVLEQTHTQNLWTIHLNLKVITRLMKQTEDTLFCS